MSFEVLLKGIVLVISPTNSLPPFLILELLVGISRKERIEFCCVFCLPLGERLGNSQISRRQAISREKGGQSSLDCTFIVIAELFTFLLLG